MSDKNSQEVFLSLKKILPDFEFDLHFFKPEGFSFNALSGDQYATMHVTPQGSENYLSFELDQIELGKVKETVKKFLDICKPISYDIVLFSSSDDKVNLEFSDYKVKQISTAKTNSGYNMLYTHFYNKINIEPFVI